MKLITFFFFFYSHLAWSIDNANHKLLTSLSQTTLTKRLEVKELKKLSLATVDLLLDLDYKIKILGYMHLENSKYQATIKKHHLQINEMLIRLKMQKTSFNIVFYPMLKLRQLQYFEAFQQGVESSPSSNIRHLINIGLANLPGGMARYYISSFFDFETPINERQYLLPTLARVLLGEPHDINETVTLRSDLKKNLVDSWNIMFTQRLNTKFSDELNDIHHRLNKMAQQIDYIWLREKVFDPNPSLINRVKSSISSGSWSKVHSGKTCHQIFRN